MATVIAEMSMSLDGFVATPSDGVEEVFDWYMSGDVEVPTAKPDFTFTTREVSAAEIRDTQAKVGAMLHGRRTFEAANWWGGIHPMGVPAFVVTHSIPDGWPPHPDTTVTLVTDGLESAVEQAKAAAGDKVVSVGAASIAQQCLNAGLLDGIRVNLAPVLLGEGIPFFANLENTPVWLDGPRVVAGEAVTHLEYRVRS
jgi:dihydrofolate reductase